MNVIELPIGKIAIQRSVKRRTLTIQIKQGQAKVYAPSFITLAEIERFISKKSSWITQKLVIQRRWLTEQNKQLSTPFNSVYILGRCCQINVEVDEACRQGYVVHQNLALELAAEEKSTNQVSVVVPSQELSNNANYLKKIFLNWFLQQAQVVLPKRCHAMSQLTGLTPKQLSIKLYKARWGSCDNRNQIKLNYLLMMLPIWVIDYVIIHELSHLVHLNHSKQFWALVNRFCSDTDNAKRWLKQHNLALTVLRP